MAIFDATKPANTRFVVNIPSAIQPATVYGTLHGIDPQVHRRRTRGRAFQRTCNIPRLSYTERRTLPNRNSTTRRVRGLLWSRHLRTSLSSRRESTADLAGD